MTSQTGQTGSNMFRIEGKTALVTGGDKGLGAAIAVALAQGGADVMVTSRSGRADDTLRAIAAAGRRGEAFAADFETPGSAEGLVAEALRRLGRLDILVNNAGIQRRADVLDFPMEYWESVMQINLKACWILSQNAARHMAERGSGKIINIASVLSFQGGLRVHAYAAAKHALAGLTKSMANELASKGINVNAIAPGYMNTDNIEALVNDPVRSKQLLERIPAGRWGVPEDLAGPALFLASAASDYVHGHVLVVDGAWLTR
jgi:2-deoxy-D-gluconate 3-dehydrogenase